MITILSEAIFTTRQLVRELSDKPDDYITVTVGDREYSISHTKMIKTHANVDDGVMHRTLVCDEMSGNIVR